MVEHSPQSNNFMMSSSAASQQEDSMTPQHDASLHIGNNGFNEMTQEVDMRSENSKKT